MKKLDQHNAERRASLEAFSRQGERFNGIICPKCDKCELVDTQPNVTLTSDPPQKTIACRGCGYTGYRLA